MLPRSALYAFHRRVKWWVSYSLLCPFLSLYTFPVMYKPSCLQDGSGRLGRCLFSPDKLDFLQDELAF